MLMVILLTTFRLPAQEKKRVSEYRSPVNYPITLAGSFAEIRRNHFHSGIDIRTGGAEGKPVFAIEDGYVSRVNISAVGFGKALYIDHPDGHTSLYAHLQRYAGSIASWVKAQQYERESFTMDVEVKPGLLKVKKGDLIAYTGNSGSSGGPHLHFEIRDTKTQEILDPIDFGFMKPDETSPKINQIRIYPRNKQAMINFKNAPLTVLVHGSNGRYSLQGSDTISVTGSVIFGVETTDQGEGSLSTGVHVIRLEVDDVTVFSQNIDRFAFAETRYVNSILDYPLYVKEKRKVQRSFVAPNNKMGVFDQVKNQGIVHFSSAGIHTIRYTVEDGFGHRSKLDFFVKSHPPPGRIRPQQENEEKPACSAVFTYKTDNLFQKDGIRLEVPREAVYEEFPFEFSEMPALTGSFSPVFQVHNTLTPLHTWAKLSLKCEGLPANIRSKALVALVSGKNRLSSVGGEFSNGWITAKIREFGKFVVVTDTKPPVIVPVNIAKSKNVRKQTSIRIKISDNMSGISTYRGTLNDKWVLMEYDAKNNLLVYTFDEKIKAGRNQFRLVVTDAVGNSSTYDATLQR
jgi:hypothetical protein